ncbi:hypothetical protein CLI92_08945 [Vandammella animalimorsus]|uniref:Uncharacterized protein n=1 Tax=Vandammella animalimorsus TaxID=2029117 RepID=A0A2A2T4S9_9BURK|nr:hypothetical protein CK620_07040 [Vandammella animalimorsus]PAX16450.1 hypothetical protein CLI92_08945 [Vandammella animalimorsus]PAX18865.1 hypothetical protein CLI93_11025 [Vandammella animalimorsus]
MFDYSGTWREHDERCEWSSAGYYKWDVDVVTKKSATFFERQEHTLAYNNPQCTGTVLHTIPKEVEYLSVVGQGQLADGTRVDLIDEKRHPNGPVVEKCVAVIQDGKLFSECHDAPRGYPTYVERHEWDVRLP